MSDAQNSGADSGAANTQNTFSAEYVKELRQENAGYRVRAQKAEADLTELQKVAQGAKEVAEKATKDAEERATKAEQTAQARIIKAELKAHAIKAGILDLDGLALADLAAVKLDDKGEVQGADEAIAALRKAKPYLFTTTTASGGKGGDGQPPNGGKPTQKRATDMPPEEYVAFKRSKGLAK